MRIYLLLIIALVISSCSDTTKVKELSDRGKILETYYVLKSDKNIKEGIYTRYNEAGQIVEEANYSSNKLNGERKLYYTSGKLEVVETYDNDIFEGPYKSYFESGNISSSGMYVNSEMTDVWKYFYDLPNEIVKEEVQFSNSMENGPFKEYYESGQLKVEGTYLNESEDGVLKEYSELGKLIKEILYKEGKMIKYKELDEQGNTIKEQDYSNLWEGIEYK